MRAVRIDVVVLACVISLAATDSGGAGLRDVQDGWLLDARSTPVLFGREEGVARWFEVGSMRLHGVAALPATSIAGGWGRPGWSIRAAWQTLGNGLVREDGGRLRLVVGDRTGPGLEWEGHRTAVEGRSVVTGHDLWLVLCWRRPFGDSGVVHAEGRWPLAATGSTTARRVNRCRAGVIRRGWALECEVSVRYDGTPAVGVELAAVPGGAVALVWRLDVATGAAGPGLVWDGGTVAVRTSHVLHPRLGVTHRFGIGWRGRWSRP